MPPWIERPTIELDESLPMGRRFEHVDDAAIDGAKRLLDSIREQLPSGSSLGWLANAIRLRTGGRFHGEMQALAAMAGVGWREIAVANVSYDLTMAIGCSTIALPTGDGPVLARNMDWWPEDLLAQSSYLLRTTSQGRLRYANAGWPGAVGVVTGLSGNGFAVALNAVHGRENRDVTGYPVLLHLRRVLEDATGFEDAVESLKSTRLATSGLFTVVGTTNEERVVIERSTKRAALRWGEPNRPLVATNHYRKLFHDEGSLDAADELLGTSCGRYDTLVGTFDDRPAEGAIADEQLLYVLTEPDVILGITAQHIVMRPRSGSIRLYVPRRYVEPSEPKS